MESSTTCQIDLKALEQGRSIFEFDLDDAFFRSLETAEVQHGQLKTTVTVNRTGDCFNIDFHTVGSVAVPCDLCLDDMEQPVTADGRLAARFGDSYAEEDDLVTVAEDEGILDVAWFVYESIALSIPIRHVHAPGKCNPAMIGMLEAHAAARSSEDKAERPVDPRWAALSDLKLED